MLKDRAVLVTGAAGGLGAVVAERVHAHGGRLALIDLSTERLQDIAKNIGAPESWIGEVDILDEAALQNALSEAEEKLGGLDVVVHTVGGFAMGTTVHETSEADWRHMFDLNLWSCVRIAQAAVPILKKSTQGGRIIFVSARAALEGTAKMGAYCASKGALLRVIESMSSELLLEGVTVNSVLPSIIDTPGNRAAMPNADPTTWVSPASLGEVISFLASDGARDISGAAIPVYGKC